MLGSVTERTKEAATAASKAFPPSSRILSPTSVAKGCAVAITPFEDDADF